MEREKQPVPDDFEDDVEQAMDDKLEGVLAADTTGMVNSEMVPQVVVVDEKP
jgi:hypothetical protein